MYKISILTKLGGNVDAFTSKEKAVKKYIIENLKDIVNISIGDLSDATGASKATISRFCRKLGYKNFREFSLCISHEAAISYSKVHESVQLGDSAEVIVQKLCSDECDALEDTRRMIDLNKLNEIVALMMKMKQTVLFGIGGSSVIAHDLNHKLCRLGIKSRFEVDTIMQRFVAESMQQGELAVVISLSGYDAEMLDLIRTIQSRGAMVVCMTSDYASPMARSADFVLYGAKLSISEYSGTVESRLSLMYLNDLIFVLLSLRGAPDTIQSLEDTTAILDKRQLVGADARKPANGE
ncbi:MAG: MurR/RpiR family transcriptional regulator [Bacillota bacterium]